MSEMIEVKSADLIGTALDWAVCEVEDKFGSYQEINDRILIAKANRYSSYWGHGGPLIEKYMVLLTPPNDLVHRNFGSFDKRNGWYESGHWGSTIFGKERKHRRASFNHQSSPLIVAMRAIVQFELGDTVSVPAELIQP